MTTDTTELRRLYAAATPGTWFANSKTNYTLVEAYRTDIPMTMQNVCTILDFDDRPSRPNAALIAAAINALPDLLDELERLRADMEMLQANIENSHPNHKAWAVRVGGGAICDVAATLIEDQRLELDRLRAIHQ